MKHPDSVQTFETPETYNPILDRYVNSNGKEQGELVAELFDMLIIREIENQNGKMMTLLNSEE